MQYTLTTESEPDEPPNASESWETMHDFAWALRRFTAPAWSLKHIDFEHNDHCGAKATALDATLTHDSTSILRIDPFDPCEFHPGPTIYRSNRVRLENALDETTHYLTFGGEAESLLPDNVTNPVEHLTTIDDQVSFVDSKDVHEADRRLRQVSSNHNRGYGVDGVWNAIATTIAGANRISRKAQSQASLGDF